MSTGRIHAGHVRTSPRLRKVYEFLRARGGRGATTFEIIRACQVCAVNSIISELRHNGLGIDCKDEGLNDQRSHVFRYTLVELGRQLHLFGAPQNEPPRDEGAHDDLGQGSLFDGSV
jgi:hypothetical protein